MDYDQHSQLATMSDVTGADATGLLNVHGDSFDRSTCTVIAPR